MLKQALLYSLLFGFFIGSTTVNAEKLTLSDITVKKLNGQSEKLGKVLSNKPVYLKFWATWCQPCREQMPHLQQTFDRYGKKIDIVSINLGVNDSLADVIKTKNEFKLTLPIFIDETAKLSQTVDLIATPYHVLIDSKGRIVHKGHKASVELDSKIKKLADNNQQVLAVTPENNSINPLVLDTNVSQPTLLFFASTWCDWYLEKSRPQMSANCVNAQNVINNLYNKYPHMNWHGILTRLWTGQKELDDYRKKYSIQHPLSIDSKNEVFLKYRVKKFPTLIAIKGDREIFRLDDFSDSARASKMLLQLENNY